MGLFDSIGGQLINALGQGQAGASQGGLMEVVIGLVNNPQTGGLAGLVEKFQAGGLGDVVSSWIGTGHNLPVSADQIASVLGQGQLQEIAQKLGIDASAVSGHLAQALPQVVDKLTPNGTLPDSASVDSFLNSLTGKG